MQNVIALRTTGQPRKERSIPVASSAEIVIFPGVRYERHAASSQRGGKPPQRDVLDLGE